ncbi:T9SS type A sorting domain-containing protein [Hymenobacter sp. BRD128]|uniref:T9SS type A sorting domain-containing protein n=1 Tax=Hymenobacter sp. BRD128 TaxID=2675878 RepID=UPI001563DD8B|nr:T9SS type A sorting domain-containing protein [Hymenobacter sp. BRD128]QKG55693.1 T9SS type A sorting domain-containing protein [Hymenobacter sp. BRD128]
MKLPLTLVLALPALAATAQTLTNDGATLTVTSGATLYVAGTVQNNATGTLSNAGTVQLTGDLTNAGTLASPGTLLFSGAQDQTFTSGAASVSSLTLANTGATGANRLLLSQDLAVSSLLTLTQGLVRTQVAGGTLRTLSLPDGASVVGEQAGRYVQGRLQVARASVSGSTGSVDFTNGLVLNPNGQDLGAVTVTRTAGLQQAGVSYGTNINGTNINGTNKGIDRVWQVTSGQPVTAATPASVTVSWVSDDDNGFNPATPAQLWRADQASGPWATQGAAASASARSFTANVTQLGTLTVSNTSQPLPITLVSFTAQAQGPDGLLLWSTASELRNDHFVVESSLDGVTFQALGQVAGHGTTTLPHSYQLLDRNLARYAASVVYYRLRQVDQDGTASYSPVRTVAVPVVAGLALFPNPTRAAATLTGAAPGAPVQVYDALGRLVLAATADAAGTAALQLPAWLATGVYLVRTGASALRLSVTD